MMAVFELVSSLLNKDPDASSYIEWSVSIHSSVQL